MMTGGAIGTFLGAWTNGLVGHYDLTKLLSTGTIVQGGPGSWRTVFFVGVVPAVLLMIIRGPGSGVGPVQRGGATPPSGQRGSLGRPR